MSTRVIEAPWPFDRPDADEPDHEEHKGERVSPPDPQSRHRDNHESAPPEDEEDWPF